MAIDRRIRASVVLTAAIVVSAMVAGVPSAIARPHPGTPLTTWIYPSINCPTNADHGLQDCVDNASAGDTILLSQQAIDETVLIFKSLTLGATSPTLRPRLGYVAVRDWDIAAGDPGHPGSMIDIDVTVKDIDITTELEGTFRFGVLDHLDVDNVRVGIGAASPRGLAIDAQEPANVNVEGGFFRSGTHQTAAVRFYAQHSSGRSHFRIVGSRATGHNDTDGMGSGIEATAYGGASVEAQIYNNRIWDVVHNTGGGASGIFLYGNGTGTFHASVVGNTLDDVGSNGIGVRGGSVAPGKVVLDVFDNIVTHADGPALVVDNDTGADTSLRTGFNDYFAVGEEINKAHRAGTNLHVNPQYVDAASGDLRLKATSPLIDAGQACTSGGLANLDASGNARVSGVNIDLGADEFGAKNPTGTVILGGGKADNKTGTPGGDIMCGFAGNDHLVGRGGNDFIDAGPGEDRAAGGPDNDRIIGGAGPDLLLGDLGNDVLCALDGVRGNDVLRGDAGADRGRFDRDDTAVSVEKRGAC